MGVGGRGRRECTVETGLTVLIKGKLGRAFKLSKVDKS